MDQDQQVTGDIDVAQETDGWVVRMRGEVDAGLRDAASAVMVQVIGHRAPVVVDLADVTFIDSSGLAFVLQLWSLGQEDGTAVVLRDPPGAVLDLLDVIGVGDRIPVERTALTEQREPAEEIA